MNRESLTRSDLWKIYRCQLLIRAGLNFERHQNSGFTTAMEERYALEKSIDPESINAVKSTLMGPLAALGDSLINGTIRPLLASMAISLAVQGNVIGPILFFIGMSIISLGIRYLGVFKGYEKGIQLVDDIQKSGLITRLTEISSVAAFVIVGGFIPSVVNFAFNIHVASGDTDISIQESLDSLMPGIMPIAITLLMYWLITKKNINPLILMLMLMLSGIIGLYIGIF